MFIIYFAFFCTLILYSTSSSFQTDMKTCCWCYSGNEMNYKGSGKVHFGVDDVSLYGTPKEEPGPGLPGQEVKQSFLKNQLQALFQPTDNKLAMKLFGSKKALMKERIRQKAAGHWVIHPCSSFRWVQKYEKYLFLLSNPAAPLNRINVNPGIRWQSLTVPRDSRWNLKRYTENQRICNWR